MEIGKPIKLIELSPEGEFSISEEAMNTLKELGNKRVAPITLAGPLKNIVRNRFLGQPKGFSASDSTRGIWMWSQPVKLAGNRGSALILDVEGLVSGRPEDRLRLLALSLLLSSVLVYNTSGPIVDKTWDDLAMLEKLHEVVRIDGKEFARDFARYAPGVFWAVHDSPVEGEGFRDYFKDCFKPKSSPKDPIRQAFSNYFTQWACCTLPKTSNGEGTVSHKLRLGLRKALRKARRKSSRNRPHKDSEWHSVDGRDVHGTGVGVHTEFERQGAGGSVGVVGKSAARRG